jgi:4,5-dihydroxyphthalate decarboxylase
MAFDNRLPITLASGTYDITQPLINGLIDVEGVKLNVLADFISVDPIFRRMLNLEFEAAEMSTSHYLLARQRGIPIVAVPVFLNRLFPHSFLYKNKNAGIKGPADLRGKKVGLPQYQATRPMWVRGIFEDFYGVKRTDVTWVTDFPEKMDVKLAPGIKLERAPEGKTIDDLLAAGELAAAMCWYRPKFDNVVPLFDDTKAEEIQYYKQTGMFPIMHTVVVKQEIVDRCPWVPRCIVEAYAQSKRMWYRWRNRFAGGSLPLCKYDLLAQNTLLGEDPFPFNVEKNLKVIQTSARYSAADQFIKPIDDVGALWVQDVDTRAPTP